MKCGVSPEYHLYEWYMPHTILIKHEILIKGICHTHKLTTRNIKGNIHCTTLPLQKHMWLKGPNAKKRHETHSDKVKR